MNVPGRRGRGVGLGNWIVDRTSGFLDARLSRRSFIARATLLGSAVAASGCAVVVRPGSPYARITDCGPNDLCRDGFTEFCCAINNGVNACPPNTLAAGWWRADFSVYCNGTRYYIDCNEVCCGPVRRDGFCAGCNECRCAHGCDTRKVHCNYFRYGQCNQIAYNVGPIACRMVTCVPPYQLDLGCSPSGAVDNSTANHFTDCARYAPPPTTPQPPPPPPPPPPVLLPSTSVGSAVARTGTELDVVVRGTDQAAHLRRLIGGTWHDWASLGGSTSSRTVGVSNHTGRVDLFTRGTDQALYQTTSTDSVNWTPWTLLGTGIGSDPAPVRYAPGIWVFVRTTDGTLFARSSDGSTWRDWVTLGSGVASNPVPVVLGSQLFVFVRLVGGAFSVRRYDGAQWQEWTDLGGSSDADPGAVAFGTKLVVFQKSGTALQMRVFDGSTWGPWSEVAPDNVASSPEPVVFANRVSVFVRGVDLATRVRAWDGSSWGAWTSLGGATELAPEPTVFASNLYVFVRGLDRSLDFRVFDGSVWADWTSLGGVIDAVNGEG